MAVRWGLAAGMTFATALLSPAGAQGWPTRSVSLVIPFTAGTTVDIVGRGIAEFMAEKLGQPIVIDNRTGAGGTTGGAAVAKAAADGYTILLSTTGPASIAKLLYKSLPYDPERDLAPIVLVGKSPVFITGRPTLPFDDVKGLVAHLKAQPDSMTAGMPGNGTMGHIAGELLKRVTGIRFAVTQHRGSPSIIGDLIGGHLDIGMDSMAPYVPQVQDGKLKGLGIASPVRWPTLPSVQTVAEQGFPGFEATVWYAMLAPTGTPADVVGKLNAVTNAWLDTEKAKSQFASNGLLSGGGSPAALKAFIASEFERWGPVIKNANIDF